MHEQLAVCQNIELVVSRNIMHIHHHAVGKATASARRSALRSVSRRWRTQCRQRAQHATPLARQMNRN